MYVDKESCDPRKRLVEMNHARVHKQNGCIRVLIATIAYGMGKDCKGVKDVIHYEPPQNLERYLQKVEEQDGCRNWLQDCNFVFQGHAATMR